MARCSHGSSDRSTMTTRSRSLPPSRLAPPLAPPSRLPPGRLRGPRPRENGGTHPFPTTRTRAKTNRPSPAGGLWEVCSRRACTSHSARHSGSPRGRSRWDGGADHLRPHLEEPLDQLSRPLNVARALEAFTSRRSPKFDAPCLDNTGYRSSSKRYSSIRRSPGASDLRAGDSWKALDELTAQGGSEADPRPLPTWSPRPFPTGEKVAPWRRSGHPHT